jgi:DNA damage-binding protein 1
LQVNFMASFNTVSFPDSLAIVKEETLTIGSIDSIQKLHVRTVPLHEQPRRVAYQASTRTFAAATTNVLNRSAAGVPDSVRLIDEQTFETVSVFKLDDQELGTSLASVQFADDPSEYYVLGTGYVLPGEMEPSKGRIVVLKVVNGECCVVSFKETHGAVYSCVGFQGKLVAGITGRAQLYSWQLLDDESRQLVPECSHTGHVLALYLDVKGDYVLIGDIMRSITLLRYVADENKFEVRARDYRPAYTTSAAILDDDLFLGTDSSLNVFICRLNQSAASDEERSRLDVTAQAHLAEFVNKVRKGALVMRPPDSMLADVPTWVLGTIAGSLLVLARLPAAHFNVAVKLERALRAHVGGVGGFDHADYRAFAGPFSSEPTSAGIVDGDLICQLNDLSAETQAAVAAEVGASLDVLTVLADELARLA